MVDNLRAMLCRHPHLQRTSSSISAQRSVNKKSLHSPGVSAVLNLKASTTTVITSAIVKIQDVAGACAVASHSMVSSSIHFLYLESQ